MDRKAQSSGSLAASITKSASKQAYYTIRFFADRDRVEDAYRAYGYFWWVDDVVDDGSNSREERSAFVNRQKSLLDSFYRGEVPNSATSKGPLVFTQFGNASFASKANLTILLSLRLR
jgi:phytoene/squalene synthetase